MYEYPHQFEPLLIAFEQDGMLNKAADIVTQSIQLTGMAHETTRASLRELVRSMNSYYSNRIEGQGTHPLNIERALHNEFSAQPDTARLQRIAVAHIASERELEALVAAGQNPLKSSFLVEAHQALYGKLDEADRTTDDGEVVIPGAIRDKNVAVGRHIPPDFQALQRFFDRMDDVYAARMSWDVKLIAIACLHHRSAWVHPFLDGNGRTVRLQTHCGLWELSKGLWSASRGLAREQRSYYAKLSNADQPRRGDLDGRGNLTMAGLQEWVSFFLDVCADQVGFMGQMLDLGGIKQRIEALIYLRASQDKAFRTEMILPLFHVFLAGSVKRGEFSQMTGLGERTARSMISTLLSAGILTSDSAQAPVKMAFPLDCLHILFPGLYPEASVKEIG